MPDERREFHTIRPASHTLLSVNCLYQMNMEKRKGMFTKWVRGSEPETQGPRSTPPPFTPGVRSGQALDFARDDRVGQGFWARRGLTLSFLYQPAARSLNSGFVLAISHNVFSLRQFFSCFSRAMVLCTSPELSQQTSRTAS